MEKITSTIKREKTESLEIYNGLRDAYKQMQDGKENFSSMWNSLRIRVTEIRKELSYADDEILDLMHYIELTTCDCVKLAKIIKKIKEVRLKRRKIKNELEFAEDTLKVLSTGKQKLPSLSNNYCKSYNFRTSVIDEILKEDKNG